MTQIGHHLDSAAAKNITLKHEDDYEDDDDEDSDDDEEEARGVDNGSEQPQPAPPFQQEALSRQPRTRQRTSLSPEQLNPPEVQKVVVEHVVRNTDLLSSFPRLRPFSGKTPKQSNEADYDSWRGHIALLLTDPSLSALQVTRRIMESLLSPAADLVKGLKPDTLPAVFLNTLDAAFGTVQDGEELMAQFLNTLQIPGERPSAYLQRLQLALSSVVKQGGVSPSEVDRHLLKQFCCGCWDNSLIMKLQLEQQKTNPPSFSDLLLQLRTEEDRQLAKESLMKQYIGSAKQKATIQSHSACSCGHSPPSNRELKEMKEQLQRLQKQMSQLLTRNLASSTKPKPWYCFNCGEDGHVSSTCTNRANPILVQQKKTLLHHKASSMGNQASVKLKPASIYWKSKVQMGKLYLT
uniref:CCHC-type domain-containing protein n=1 Tax=Oryzias sinensis TaxID=183150 RepID=A0A8C7WXI8_9TELE